MKIGILAFHAASNFGANLQVLSTVEYLKKTGHEPIVVNFIPEVLEQRYKTVIPDCQFKEHLKFRNEHFNMTDVCRNSQEVASEIEKHNIEAVIIGSDAVVQHMPLLKRIRITPSRKSLVKFKITPKYYETTFPNPFWGEFINYLNDQSLPVAMLSVSCEDTDYLYFTPFLKKKIFTQLRKMKYISVRDNRTQKLFQKISKKELNPSITPDPVFAMNFNFDKLPSKKEILNKFNLPEKYILMNFLSAKKIDASWLKQFKEIAEENYITCFALPNPSGVKFKNEIGKFIDIPLSPIDWYSLIRYSTGYIGEKMHTIVSALHNCTPFFSFDNHGINRFIFFTNENASKIKHIIDKSGFYDNRVSIKNSYCSKTPTPKYVFEKLENFDREKATKFSSQMHRNYIKMMNELLLSITY